MVAPTAKRPELFRLATPIEVDGHFEEFSIGTCGAGIPGTAVRFLASPVTTPMLRVVKSELPRDGNDVCGAGIGPSATIPERSPRCRNP